MSERIGTRTEHYILDRSGKLQVVDLLTWARWMESSTREEFHFESKVENYRISTVFLGLDHNFSMEGPPILWESMVFNQDFKRRPLFERPTEEELNDKLHQYMDRCAGGLEQAEAMHKRMVEHVKQQLSVRKEA